MSRMSDFLARCAKTPERRAKRAGLPRHGKPWVIAPAPALGEKKQNMNDTDHTISKYDRLRGSMHDVAMFTKPSTIKNVQTLTGRAETFVIETCRYEDRGDYIFVECVDETGVTRLALPPKVADVIASQRESLTTRRRSNAAKKLAQERKARGEVPAFMRGKKGRKV